MSDDVMNDVGAQARADLEIAIGSEQWTVWLCGVVCQANDCVVHVVARGLQDRWLTVRLEPASGPMTAVDVVVRDIVRQLRTIDGEPDRARSPRVERCVA
jgi:hypothetical protein